MPREETLITTEEDLTKNISPKDVAKCELVCKLWKDKSTSRTKVEMAMDYKFPKDSPLHMQDYDAISEKKLFNRNLLKNPSGENEFSHWWVRDYKQSGWATESLPKGVTPLPDELKNTKFCFLSPTSDTYNSKIQNIDLIEEGFTENILDNYRPWIEVPRFYFS